MKRSAAVITGDNAEILCATSPDAHRTHEKDRVCGGGIDQPAWPACRERGTWLIRRYQHAYCSDHAAIRLHTWHLWGGLP
ncbi:hypothetical protein ABZ215_13760 [Amycolatopsis sp. NPDC006131]|uniref:hypothetical protein n=1 Tax=Amycolatopsis sp. NPDC006131 TaxID=3156731 RepID=UPI0033B4FB3F